MTVLSKTNKPKNLKSGVHLTFCSNLFNVWPNKEDSCVSHLLLHHQSVAISHQTASRKLQGTPTTE